MCLPAAAATQSNDGESMTLASHYSYWMTILLMITGLYIVVARGNLLFTNTS